MNARLYDRLAAGISVALLLALGAGTYYLAQISGRFDRPALGRPVGHEPDYFVEKLVFTRLNARGEPAFRVSAERALHFQDDGTTEYESPRLVSLDPARPRVTVNARQGRTAADGNETHLEGDVVLTRHAAPGSPPIVVTTDYAVVHADTEVARTDRPAFSFQGHPEASPGPHDIEYLFDRFVALMEKN